MGRGTSRITVDEFRELFQAMKSHQCWTNAANRDKILEFADFKGSLIDGSQCRSGNDLVKACRDDLKSSILQNKLFGEQGNFGKLQFDEAFAVEKTFIRTLISFRKDIESVERVTTDLTREVDLRTRALQFLHVLTDNDVVQKYDTTYKGPVSTFMNMKDLGLRFKQAIQYVQDKTEFLYISRWKTLATNWLLDPEELKHSILGVIPQE
eukprot:GHVU01020713.1.p1 GENE.GHVU01020713.1~~GHVU01020713.1.p1  ORF type:complete len:209 (-),score=11.21 GHVU01020713.1:71-697(-)